MKFFLVFIQFISLTLFFGSASAYFPFVVVTPEKTGTHLLTKLMGRLVKKEVQNCWEHEISSEKLQCLLDESEQNNRYVHIHAYPTGELIQYLKEKQYKVIFLMRDPRDVVVSLLYYIEKGWAMGPCSLDRPYGFLSLEDKMHELITGKRYGFSAVQNIIVKRLPWMYENKSFVYTARFEKLVGPKGGGIQKEQEKEINSIAKHIGLQLSLGDIEEAACNLWGAEPGVETTFRKGRIGSWKEEFTERHAVSFKKRFNQLLIDLGYEENSNWSN